MRSKQQLILDWLNGVKSDDSVLDVTMAIPGASMEYFYGKLFISPVDVYAQQTKNGDGDKLGISMYPIQVIIIIILF